MKFPTICLSLSLLTPISCAQSSKPAAIAPVPSAPNAAAPVPNAAISSTISKATLLGTIQNPEIDELSGMAASRRYPGLIYVHNDSGDSARIFLLNQKGETVATITLKGAYARDWEDMALSGTEVYVGDIGDNLGIRDAVQIYRFSEPALDPQKLNQSVEVQPQVCAFRMLGTPRDAETLLIEFGGKVQLLSKEKGVSELFGAVFKPKITQNLKSLGVKMKLGSTGYLTKLATGGDYSPDGRKLVVTTYAQLYEWRLSKPFYLANFAQLTPVVRTLPGLSQCESVCYSADGQQIFVSSEGKAAPIYAFKSAF